ncbi:FecR family protein [Rhodospirillum centenum]|uniref:Sigma factor regulatory protein, FecR n=1 Tax=Rhodospirillum centenum (strain ATCC 51521 / SW) TaxID=414684 RepID=B6IY13_RHOCS|nr:FecR domain-containing protein [Rhodospirillum centenum]ACJ01187.1 sigma factor regulatory protein, FecR [Rhodospirillum centenum SW]
MLTRLFPFLDRRRATARAEAGRWWLLMRDDAAAPQLLAAFSDWLEADPAHPAAFEEACRRLGPSGPARSPRPAPRRSWRPALALAAVLAAAVIGAHGLEPRPDIAVPPGQWQEDRLADGSGVAFGPGSRGWLRFDERLREIRLDTGSVIVEAAPDPQRPLVVETPHGSVRVVGTRFLVVADGSRTGVTVSHGVVETVAAAQPEERRTLRPPDHVQITPAGIVEPAPGTVADTPDEVRQGWRSFAAAPLADVTGALAAASGERILVLPTAPAAAVTGRFRMRDAGATLALLADAYGLRRLQPWPGTTVIY